MIKHAIGIALGLAGLYAALELGVSLLPKFLLPRDPGGDRNKGLAIFVESIRWLSVAWGRRGVASGLRQGGFEGQFLHWRWHEAWRGWLVLPALADAEFLRRQARRLAEFIVRQKQQFPQAPVYLVGYSCGAFVMAQALEMLPEAVQVDGAAMLAAAVAPDRDLEPAARRVRGKFIVCSSINDWLICGLGTLIFGTADRRHSLSAGMVGPRRAPGPNTVRVRWRPAMIRLGYTGGHFSAPAAAFIARHVAPPLLGRS